MPRKAKSAKRTGVRFPRKAPGKKKRRKFSRRHISSAPGKIAICNGRVVMVLPRRLKSPNQIKTHWAYMSDREAWRRELERAEVDETLGVRLTTPIMIHERIRMRLDILRLAPSRRYLLDKDNKDYCAKRLQDALKEFGYIVDDNDLWLDGPYVTQDVSHDKKYWAVVTLTPLAPGHQSPKESCGEVGIDPQMIARQLLLGEDKGTSAAGKGQS